MKHSKRRTLCAPATQALLVALAVASTMLAGCAAAVGTAVVGGSMLAVDRRSSGAQLDDQTIELRSATTIGELLGDKGHVSATSYNRVVLLTGQVPTEADRGAVEAAVRRVDNVRAVVNELGVGSNASASDIANDSIVTGKVKAAFFDAKDLQFASIKVVTERGVVYLMGRLTEAESQAAGDAARAVGGVKKVVKVFEIITPAELAAMPLPPGSTAPAASAPRK